MFLLDDNLQRISILLNCALKRKRAILSINQYISKNKGVFYGAHDILDKSINLL